MNSAKPPLSPRPAASRVVSLRLALVLLMAVLGIAVVAFVLRPAPAPEGNLSGAPVGGSYHMIDEQGHDVTEASYAGKWRLMYFGYSFCPDVCPTDMAKFGEGLRAFARDRPGAIARLAPLFVTVDPERDTPAALREFTDSFHPAIIGLTGTPDEVAAMLKAYRIFAQKVPGATADSYSIDHLAVFYLMDPKNRPVAFLSSQTATPDDIAALLERYIR